ncbi:MAG: hypothetical protein MJZ93_00025 [Paludibacteraceae bacterium]|nr:hypothetical protein [Paludibacteraceae bacterium]
MAGKVLGIDLGTNSIGLSVRDTDIEGKVSDQLVFFTSVIFEEGTGRTDKGTIKSLAAERTKHRSSRRLNQARRYRIWRTLDVLIKYGYCPLSIDELDRWRHYDKSKAVKRLYPIENYKFEQWVRLDFNLDGIPDYSSPYQLRAELAETKLDLSQQINRFKLGRALYHIAQRRGFKSSKGETLNDMEKEATEKNAEVQEVEMFDALKESEKKKSSGLKNYMTENGCKTAGVAFAMMERDGIRVRGNGEFQAVRDLYEEEVRAIFQCQDIDVDKDFGLEILSRKRNEGSIFFKRPLRSQKGTVGKCTLEPSKSRCPISRPEFEEFRAWTLINNIKYRLDENEDFRPLDLQVKRELFDGIFTRAKKTFKFSDIEKFLINHFSYTGKVLYLNYKNNTTVSGCPVINRLKQLLGDDWKNATLGGHSSREKDKVKLYNYDELWHVCFAADDAEDIMDFCAEHLDDDKSTVMVKLWSAISDGYANLSLKAINNINRLLFEGLIYSDAVLWAKVADIIGIANWERNKDTMLDAYDVLKENVAFENTCSRIANNVITYYRMLPDEKKFAINDTSYIIDDDDRKDVRKFSEDMFSPKVWRDKSAEEKQKMLDRVAVLYQGFFADSERKMVKVPKLTDAIADFITEHFGDMVSDKYKDIDLSTVLYHPSAIDIYPKAKERTLWHNGNLLSLRLLNSPATNVFRNPMVMRVLHQLRRQINNLLIDGIIDENTRIVVETAREFNDANVRAAIEKYQRAKEDENAKFRKRLEELNQVVNDDKIQKTRLLFDQSLLCDGCENLTALTIKSNKRKFKDSQFKVDMTKYELWLEQNCRSIYTGAVIPLSKLFKSNQYDIEHTIPRSICFDDSLTNKTICEAWYNRETKKNLLPTQLPEYDQILSRIQPWVKRRDDIRELVSFWKGEAKKSSTPERKNQCIVQRHLWEMELDYWTKKVANFTKESENVSEGFRNSQLVDTRIITKYAMHFLKSVFNRVDVQRGDMTASFRKAFGIQEIYEKKSRDRHSHHAIDATMLTLIPTNQQRDRILELFYKIEEETNLGHNCDALQKELETLKQRNNIINVSQVNSFIEENILIRHISRDQTLQPARKKIRVRGKIKHFKGRNVRYATGDCVRGQLHNETYFGAIRFPVTDKDGYPLIEDGHYVYEKTADGRDAIVMVTRVPITSFKSIKDIDKIIDVTVRTTIRNAVNERMADKKSFAVALSEPIYLRDSDNNEIKDDINGRPILPIRHVRCRVAAGRGFMTAEKALTIRTQTYKSKYEYKNQLYAQNGGNYLCLLYEGDKKGNIVRTIRFINYFDMAQLHLKNSNELFHDKNFSRKVENNIVYSLKYILKAGTNVLMYENNADELRGMNQCDLNKRLFVVYKFNYQGSDYVYLQNSIESRSNESLAKEKQKADGYTEYRALNYQYRLKLSANNCNFVIEGIDFEITTNGIEFK